MSVEGQDFEKKQLDLLNRPRDLAKTCVAFANAHGGLVHVGIADGSNEAPPDQKISESQVSRIRKQIAESTINVIADFRIKASKSGGEFLEIQVLPSKSVSSTSDGRYYLRVSDESKPLMPDELSRLVGEKSSGFWEDSTSLRLPSDRYDQTKLRKFLSDIKSSDRVSDFVKEKSDIEILEHYRFVRNGFLTNLGVLWIGTTADRGSLQFAPVIQFIKRDEFDEKVNKLVWDDFSLSPKELLESVLSDIPDWQEFYEVSDGMYRQSIPSYDERIVRELVVNALVHRPYTQRGDIFVDLFHDRLEIHNPGLLPLGVTPENILHKSVKRNEHLARVFYDLKLMEREGSGFDLIYDILLSSGRPLPVVREGDDRVVVSVFKRIANQSILEFVRKADESFHLRQKERITLGIVAQSESISAIELIKQLELKGSSELSDWIGKLIDRGLVKTRGRTKGTEYFVDSSILRRLDFKGTTSLRGIERHRLRELILRDLEIYESAGIGEIHQRIGPEIRRRSLHSELMKLVESGQVYAVGERKYRKYVRKG